LTGRILAPVQRFEEKRRWLQADTMAAFSRGAVGFAMIAVGPPEGGHCVRKVSCFRVFVACLTLVVPCFCELCGISGSAVSVVGPPEGGRYA
jgi:hypothetical protein